MPARLPQIRTADEYRRVQHKPVAFWRPATTAIAERHGLEPGILTRFAAGDAVVLGSDAGWVVKLVPPIWSGVAEREVTLFRSLPAEHGVLMPRLLGHGGLDAWSYLVTSRLPGRALREVWRGLERTEQERLAFAMGGMLRALHEFPLEAQEAAAFPSWSDWVGTAVANWPGRWGLERVPARLRADGPRFLAASGIGGGDGELPRRCRLHGDLAPENTLIERRAGSWEFAGMIDFGNAMVGDPTFDYTAPTVLLAPGDRIIVRRFLDGAGVPSRADGQELRRRLMACTLIHPMGDLGDCLDLLPETRLCATWDDVARRFWPDP